ncbi:MAG: aromatic ring-hydroxylating dioxygenase subunit alpha [Myxococcales bacterium]|nr:aromatic ring-hydroxylating dioxygenase subunit alpha [Myxococcales bacterium]
MSGTHQGFARGWFVVAFSDELAPLGVMPLRYFDQALVLFRTEAGEARILDAHCPHLGAHLGVGGKVSGDAIVCPFHAWRFNGEGRCTEVPYAKKIPPGAVIKAWPTVERNGLIFVFHDRQKGPPDWEIPLLPEHGDPAWMPWSGKRLDIRTQPREIVENVADKGHFPVVHGTHVDHFENVYEGHTATQITRGIAHPKGGGQDPFSLTATYHGPAYQITHMDGVLKSRLLLAHTPIDAEHLHLRFAVMLAVFGDPDRTQKFASMYIQNLQVGFEEDIAIWENKQWRDRPVLCEGDGPIAKLRKWYRQFYPDSEEAKS